jgi:cytochrome c1
MKKGIIITIVVLPIFLHASVFKGQREYMKNCKPCHGSGTKVVTLKKADEWDVFFKNNGEIIAKLHNSDKEAKQYFSSERFKRYSKHLLDFFRKYAADSGNVPACSD